MSNREDRNFLISIARDVTNQLRAQIKGTPIRVRSDRRLIPRETNTDGWALSIGLIPRPKCRLEIWLDNYTGYNKRKFWYGFSSNRRSVINNIVKYPLEDFGKPKLTIKERDIFKKGNNWRLHKPLDRSVFGLPVLEYYGTVFYYGIYNYGDNLTRTSGREALTKRIVVFFKTVTINHPGVRASNAEREHYPAIENRKVVVTHLLRERRSYLATRRKQLDDFKCQICGMRFEDVYGPIGKRYAEAHHRIPLSKLEKVVSRTVDHLITVCSNCHRMLHRLKGDFGDVKFLKEQISLRQR